MKKRMFSLLLVLALLAGLCPAMALSAAAEGTPLSALTVGGTPVVDVAQEQSDAAGWYYDGSGTLTLTDANIEGGIEAEGDLTIKLSGENNKVFGCNGSDAGMGMSSEPGTPGGPGISVSGELTISGSGSLEVLGGSGGKGSDSQRIDGGGSGVTGGAGGSAGSGIQAANVTIQGSGSVTVTGGNGGTGGKGGAVRDPGRSGTGGKGGTGGAGICGNVAISGSGSVTVSGGNGGSGGYGVLDGWPDGDGGDGGNGSNGIKAGTVTITNGRVSVNGGAGGKGGDGDESSLESPNSSYYNNGGNGGDGSTGIESTGALTVVGGSLTVMGGSGGDCGYGVRYGDYRGSDGAPGNSDQAISGTLTTVLPVLEGSSADGSDAEIIPGKNYRDGDSTVMKLVVIRKEVPTASANDITVTYTGEAIPDSAITGTASVEGSWSFKNPAPVNVEDSGSVTAIFTPDNMDVYALVEDTVIVTINKATPTGTPTCTAITTGGKTLADAVLAIGSITPAGGTVAWDLPETTTVAANTNYAWTYTPADTANYNTLTGSVVPYPVSSGGGGGGGSASTPKSETVSVSGQAEVKVTLSGETATVGEISAADIAKAAGTAEAPKAVQIDLTALNNREVSSVAISSATFNNLAEAAKNDNSGVSGVEIVLPEVTVSIDADTLTAVLAQAEGKNITLTVNGKNTANLSAAQRDTVSGLTAPLVIDASFTANGKTISDFGGGTVSFTAPYSLPDGKTAADVKAYYLSPKGWLVPVASSYNAETGEITVYAPHFSDYVISADGDTCAALTDVNPGAWYHNAVDFAIINGLMGGYSDTAFGPDDTLTRAQLVTILWRSEGAPVVNDPMDFADVPADTWYTEAVRWAAADGIVSGYGNGSFGPDDSITREQLATILCRYAASQGDDVSLDPDTNFLSWNDVFDISDWARDSLFWCIQSGIINGTGNGILAPKGTATRAQTAQVLMKYLGK